MYVDLHDFILWKYKSDVGSDVVKKALERVAALQPAFLPLCNPVANSRAISENLHFLYTGVTQGRFVDGPVATSSDDVIIAYMSVLQSLAFSLSAPDVTETSAASTLEAIGLIARAASLRLEGDAPSQVIVTKLRNDDKAEDTLQRVLAGLLLRTPPSALGRLRMLENALKRNYKHHTYLHETPDGLRGIVSVVMLPPLLNAVRVGILTPAKAAGILVKRHANVKSLKDSTRTSAPLTRDASITHCLLRESGFSGVTPAAVASLVSFCQDGAWARDRTHRFLTNRAICADLAGMGFGAAISPATATASAASTTASTGGGGASAAGAGAMPSSSYAHAG